MMEVLAEIPTCLVKYDDERGAFFLRDDIAIWYCMSCGGSMPQPRHGDRVEPNPSHKNEALAIVESASSLEELVNVLGKPDAIVSAEDSDSSGFMAAMYRVHQRYSDIYVNDPNDRWTRYVRYGSRWPRMCLDVYEYPDGRLEPTVTGLLPNEFVIVERRPWWSRLVSQLLKAT